ncbi:MAG TPA: DinB family protein, partial [Longimicrobium sp.]|nr:DinB family protein [Longimicrobium sp.]
PRADREGALQALRDLGECFTAELAAAREQGSAGLTHPYFGRLEPIKALRFVAIHLDHHRKQIECTPK